MLKSINLNHTIYYAEGWNNFAHLKGDNTSHINKEKVNKIQSAGTFFSYLDW